jgi:hypothetical protein
MRQNRGTPHRVYETGVKRNWTAMRYASMERIEMVLDIIADHERISQMEIAEILAERLPNIAMGTIRGIVSAALLYLNEFEFVEVAEEARSTVWRSKG